VAWTEELLRNHRALSEVDIRFRDEAMRTPALMNRAYFESFGFEGEEVHYWIGRLHGWPTFVGPEFRDEMARVTEGLSRLLRLVPERIFDNDPERIAAFYRIEPYVVRLVLTPEDLALAIARADMILTEDGLRCLEYNFGSNLGGSESHSRLLFYRRVPEIQAFIEREDLDWSDFNSLKAIFAHFVPEALRRGLGREGVLNLAIISVGLPNPERFARFAADYAAVLRQRGSIIGGRLMNLSLADMRSDEAGLWHGAERVHGCFSAHGGDLYPATARMAAERKVVTYSGPLTKVLSNKANLALLSEHQESPRFDGEEREMIRRHVPWSRIVEKKEVRFRDRDWFLPDLLAAERHHLVLKAAVSMAGKDVAIGRSASDAEWQAAQDRAFGGEQWIVQEFATSVPYLFQEGNVAEPHLAVWGPFVIGGQYNGCLLRVQPAAVKGPINVSHAGSVSSVFEV